MNKKTVLALSLFLLTVLLLSSFPSVVHGETFQGWQKTDDGGFYSETNGALILSGDEQSPGPTLYREVSPQSDFEVSLQVKAATLGEVSYDPNGAGEGFALMLRPNITFGAPTGVNFELRARGGGMFLLARHNNLSWWDWTPFFYNTFEYNNGYSYCHTSNLSETAVVKPNVWYTMTLKVQKSPFVVTATVTDEAGTVLGSFSASGMVDFAFDDIKFLGISSGFGGTFYIRNIMISGVQAVSPAHITIAAEPSVIVGSPVNIHGTLTNDAVGLANELVVLKYTFPGADEWYPISSTYTDANGDYNIQWVNTATGTFTLRAEWKSNSTPATYADVTLNSLPSKNGVFYVESNSTVTSLAFNSTTSELSFTVSGPSDTSGYVKATVAKSLLPNGTNAKIYLDGNQLNYELQEMPDSWLFTFNYHHSTHSVTLDLSSNQNSASPFDIENSVWILAIIAVSFLILVLGIFLQKKKGSSTPETGKMKESIT